jgi:hypothetical protein
VVLNIFISNLQFKFVIDGQTFLLIAAYVPIFTYTIDTFKQHSLSDKMFVFGYFNTIKQKYRGLKGEYFPFIFGASFQHDQLYQVCTHPSWFTPVAFTPRPSN